MGMPIYGGNQPPKDLNGSYTIAPDVCVATNRPNDEYGPGHQFADFFLTLSKQNNKNLTITVANSQALMTGEGNGAYIVGSGDKFTIFVPMDNTQLFFHKYKTVDVYSGIATSTGIKDCYHSTYMLEGGGEEWLLIEDGQGRVAYDEDGFSEKTSNKRMSTSKNVNESSLSGIAN